MSLSTLSNNNFVNYFINLGSERIGLYISFFLHCFILLFAIGLPNFFGPSQIILPNIIPIEIVNISDTTSISKEIEENNKKEITKEVLVNKKFNNSENQEINKIDIKTKPKVKVKDIEITKNIIEDKKIEKKIKTPIKLKKEEKIIEDERFESLPTKKIQPKIKPKPIEASPKIEKNTDVIVKAQPKRKPEPEFNIATMLKDLRNEESSIVDNEKNKKVDEKNKLSEDKDSKNENSQLTISEYDLLVQQLASCWSPPAGAKIENWMIVSISANINKDARVFQDSVRIIDTNISKDNPFYKPITESAVRTFFNPECNPLKLPKDKYDLWKDLTINFDLRLMKVYKN